MTEREAFNKTKRVFYAAGRFDGMSCRAAQNFSKQEALRLWPEVQRERAQERYARRKKGIAAGNGSALLSEARRVLNSSKGNARGRDRVPLQITLERLAEELRKGRCDSCGAAFKTYRDRHADHCHATGKFRGMLCSACNVAEGYLKTSARARQLLAYMEKHGA